MTAQNRHLSVVAAPGQNPAALYPLPERVTTAIADFEAAFAWCLPLGFVADLIHDVHLATVEDWLNHRRHTMRTAGAHTELDYYR